MAPSRVHGEGAREIEGVLARGAAADALMVSARIALLRCRRFRDKVLEITIVTKERSGA